MGRAWPGLAPKTPDEGYPGGPLRHMRWELAQRRTFGATDLTALAVLLAEGAPVLPVTQAIALAQRPERMIVVRHDMDRDAENSLRFAEWEARLGIRTTYFALHSDWYWRAPGQTELSPFVLRILEKIAALGHEVGLHNNAITVALLTGEDPVAVLDRELTAMRRAGFDVTGTVAHGDPICRTAGFVNDEVFLESTHRKPGEGDRTIQYFDQQSNRAYEVTVRPVAMAELGLKYDANLLRNVNFRLTDTGGHWNTDFADASNAYLARGGLLSMLVHPLWWAFGDETVRPKAAFRVPPVRRAG